jgi:chloramphenicol-sensitive protein RarD
VLGEHMPPGRWAGFALVWLALAVFTTEALRHHRRELGRAAEAAAV